jgi:hypothetical protein
VAATDQPGPRHRDLKLAHSSLFSIRALKFGVGLRRCPRDEGARVR